MAGVSVGSRWSLVALVAIGGLLVGGYVLLPHWSTRYGAWLVAFSIWMAWFVAVAVRWIDEADF